MSNQDILYMFLISSDPIISSKRKLSKENEQLSERSFSSLKSSSKCERQER